MYWILNGKGNFPKSERKIEEKKDTPILENSKTEEKIKSNLETDLFTQMNEPENNRVIENNFQNISNIQNLNTTEDDVDYIVIFYKNGTFKKYTSKK